MMKAKHFAQAAVEAQIIGGLGFRYNVVSFFTLCVFLIVGVVVQQTAGGGAAMVVLIAVSGGVWSATDSLLYMAKQFGAKYTFAKPFEWNDLMDAVHDLLGHLENTC